MPNMSAAQIRRFSLRATCPANAAAVEEPEAEKIITSIKSGDYFAKEVWDDSIIYQFSFNPATEDFILKRADTIAGYLFPEVTLNEARLKEILLADFDVEGLSDSRVDFV